MIGYLKPHADDLRVYEYKQYKSFYCGICIEIKKHQGELPRLFLNNDITFFAVLLSSLDDKETKNGIHHCSFNLYKKKPISNNRYTKYMADINYLFTYEKICDNLRDDRSIPAFFQKLLFYRKNRKLRRMYSREYHIFENYTKQLHELEQSQSTDFIKLGELFGETLRDMFQDLPVSQKEEVGKLFYYLGQWIYCIDALDDIEKDQKSKSFNPLIPAYQSNKDQMIQEVEKHLNCILLQIVYLYTSMDFENYKGIVFNILCIAIRERTDNLIKKYRMSGQVLEERRTNE